MALLGYETLDPFPRRKARSPKPVYLSSMTPLDHARSYVARGGLTRFGEDCGKAFKRQSTAFDKIKTAEEGLARLELGRNPKKTQAKAMAEVGHMAYENVTLGGPAEDEPSTEFETLYNPADFEAIQIFTERARTFVLSLR